MRSVIGVWRYVMYRIVTPFLGMIWRILAVAALLLSGMAHPQEIPSAASTGADGVQRVTIVGGDYFFHPDRITARANEPLEINISIEPGMIPHSFVLDGPDGRHLANVELSTEVQVIHLNLKAGHYVFYCPNRLFWFKNHRERGMAGVMELRG
jgi:hypothetical protein